MFSSSTSSIAPLVGGILIGLSSLIAMLATGKIAGISGMCSRVLRPKLGDVGWRFAFLLGLVAGAALAFACVETAAVYRPVRSLAAMAVAGVLVGFGTRLSGGCTSGYGVSGFGLLSKNAMVATTIFVGTGMVTVFLLNRFGAPLGP
jgi:uncharacterized membrane protein YedE/YeeE